MTFVLITVFIVIKVLIGIVLTSMEEARELESRKRLAPDREGELEQELALATRSRS